MFCSVADKYYLCCAKGVEKGVEATAQLNNLYSLWH